MFGSQGNKDSTQRLADAQRWVEEARRELEAAQRELEAAAAQLARHQPSQKQGPGGLFR
jgi:peptidoglycan hydrolase CwlO-like protein